jgi:hypothetical protein
MTLANTEANGWAATTGAVAYGIPLGGGPSGNFAIGATLKYTIGHVVVRASDDASVIQGSPVAFGISLPSIGPDEVSFDNGTGVGLDLGGAWESSIWSVAVSVQNVFNTFEWKLEGFVYRPGEVVANSNETFTDFDEQLVTNAPAALQNQVLGQRFEPAINIGVAMKTSDRLALTADFRHDSGEALVLGDRSHIGAGVEFRFLPFLPLRGGVSRISGGGIQVAGGLALELGPVHFSGAYLSEKNSAGEFRAASFALSFAHN